MNPIFIYFLKVNIAIALFYLFYRLFFAGDTFWKTRRIYLISSIFISFVYPFFSIENWLQSQPSLQTMVANYALLQEITVTPENQSGLFSFENILWAVYGLAVFGLVSRLIVQLISILQIKFQGKRETVQGVSIIAIDKKIIPFSFFGTIYMNPALHSENETKQILTHELTHVRQGHSFDVLAGELLSIVCWFNPASWLMKREIRQNLEFLADSNVLESGIDTKTYQYHLLQLSYQTLDLKLTNKFNVSPLKKRIVMMNQQKSRKSTALKYLLIAPLTFSLVLLSNAETLASSAKQILNNENPTIQNETPAVADYAKPDDKQKNTVTPPPLPPVKMTDEMTPPPVPEKDQVIFQVVEKMPSFLGGDEALFKFLKDNVKYPAEAMKNNIQGRVICSFVVNKDGSLSDVEIIRGTDQYLDAEAVRVIKSMPNWTPGMQKGKAVSVKYTLPINFKLDDDKKDNPKEANNKMNFKGLKDGEKPLIIFDGKTITNEEISAINPENIKEINVFKDNAATAGYGEKGKNGVIIITSKK